MVLALPTLDSDARVEAHRRALDVPTHRALALGRSAVDAIESGTYVAEDGRNVDWSDAVRAAVAGKVSLPPDHVLPEVPASRSPTTRVQVANETTLVAARAFVDRGLRPLALNFANGVVPGGGFLRGARAQEEVLCRSSALFATLDGDPMYAAHRTRPEPDSTDWAILSPSVPVFRTDDGAALPEPWSLDLLTCAAPYAPALGAERSTALLRARIHRVLAIAHAYGYATLVLGAWGCGAFGNDPRRTAEDFRAALDGPFDGAFEEVAFAIIDGSRERRTLGPFRDAFGA